MMRWHNSPNDCPHYNDNACTTCDFDGYYRARREAGGCPRVFGNGDHCGRPLALGVDTCAKCETGDRLHARRQGEVTQWTP